MGIQNSDSSHFSIFFDRLNQSSHPTVASKNFFKAAAAFYIHQMHLQIMESWKRFGETERAIAKENRATHRARERKKSDENAQLLAQQKEAELRTKSPSKKILLHGVHRQMGKFRYFQGEHPEGSRHLHLPV